jgi:hypothetical protein
MPKKVIYSRYAFEDILVESHIEFNGYVEIKNDKGEILASSNTYYIGDDDEDGDEILDSEQLTIVNTEEYQEPW